MVCARVCSLRRKERGNRADHRARGMHKKTRAGEVLEDILVRRTFGRETE